MKFNMKMGLLKRGQVVNMDFDHVFIKTEKDDAKYSYKQACGYFPGVVSIDGIIAYVENRDGNTPVKFHQADTLARAFDLLKSNGLTVGIFRADCGSYSEDVIRTVDGNCHIFYIRALHSAAMYSQIQDIKDRERVEIDSQETEVASFMSAHFMEDSHYRVVVQRTKVKDDTPDLFGEKYIHRCIITNDWASDEKSIIEAYNKRGARECDFSQLNNDLSRFICAHSHTRTIKN